MKNALPYILGGMLLGTAIAAGIYINNKRNKTSGFVDDPRKAGW